MKIAVQILHHNNSSQLLKVIAGIESQTISPTSILIIDNGSSEPHLSELRRLEQRYPVLWLSNEGVGKGHNTGWKYLIEHEAPDYIWTFEHDCVPQPDCLEQLLTAVVDEFPVVYHPAEVDGLNYDVYSYFLVRLKGLVRLYDKTKMVNYKGGLSFNGLLLSPSVIEHIGYLNEFYFFGREDLDFGRRIYLNGGYSLRVNKARVFHNQYKRLRKLKLFRFIFLFSGQQQLETEFYSYRNSCFDLLQGGASRHILYLKHFIVLLITLLFTSNRFERYKIRNKAFSDALNHRLGKIQ
jgi:GT2 family glycosyltransferase